MADHVRPPGQDALRLRRTHRSARHDPAARTGAGGARDMRQRIVAIAASALWAACSPEENPRWLGYVEGEAVLVAPPQPGWITSLNVMRGAQVKTGDPLFTLDAVREVAARDNA